MENFKSVKLGDVCTFINGDRGVNYPKAEELISEGIPFINAGHIQKDKIEMVNMNYISQEKYDVLSAGKAKKGDILYCLRGSLGKHAIVEFEIGAIASSLVIFRPNSNKILSKYLLYVLNTTNIKNQMIKSNNGSSQPNLSACSVKEFLIPVPNLEQQNYIANVLDKAQELIDKRKEQIEACDELIKSLFYHMFGDPVANTKELPLLKLGELCKMKAGKGIKACDIFDSFAEGMHPCYGGNGIRGYVKDYTHEGCIPLVGRQGALCGNVKYAMGKFYATEHAIVLQSKFEVNTYWLYIMLREMNLNRLASGAAQPGLNVSTLVPLDVIFPPIQLQNKFAQKVEKIEQQKQLLEQSLTELENNFNSLMQRAFKGELF